MTREYPYPPRMMTRARAAHYCGLSETEFEREVAAGILPLPAMLGKKLHWDCKALDERLDRLASGEVPDWRATSNLYASKRSAT